MSAAAWWQIDPADLGDFGQTATPPAFAPLAAQLTSSLAPLHPILDAAYGVLLAETVLGLGDVTDAALSDATATSSAASVSADDLADLTAAQNGFSDARHQLGVLSSMFPPEDIPGAIVYDRTNPAPGNRTPGVPTSHGV